MRTSHARLRFGIAAFMMVAALPALAGFSGQVINFDFNVPIVVGTATRGGGDVFAGDNAILSSPGGTIWNGTPAFTGAMVMDVPDQFGAPTPVGLEVLQTSQFSGLTGANELQDSGLASPDRLNGDRGAVGGGPIQVGPNDIAFVVSGLLQTEMYNLAVYIADEIKASSTDVNVVHAGGIMSLFQNSFLDYDLPGQDGEEFQLFGGLFPLDLGGGSFGFYVTSTGDFAPAYIGGVQIQGVVPEPGTLALLLVGGATLWWGRRRRD